MKILQIIPSLENGGAERLVLDLSLALKEKCDVEVITLYNSDDTSYYKELKSNNIKLKNLNKKKGLDLKCLINVFKLMKKKDFDLIHCHLDSLKYIGVANLFFRKKVIYTVHNLAEKDASGNLRIIYKTFFKKKLAYPIAICDKVKKTCIQYYKLNDKEIPIIYNGINVNEINKIEQSSKCEKKDELKFLCVANFKEQKNHKYLVDLFEQISIEYKNCKLYCVGEGILKESTLDYAKSKNIEEKICFLGKRDDVYKLMKSMDVFILASKYEGFSIAILEAMACKMKIIVSDVGGNKEQIDNFKNGIIFNLNEDKDLIIKKLDYLLKNNLEEKAYTDVNEKFLINKIADDYINIYKSKLN